MAAWLASLVACGPELLARIEGASALTELGTGDVAVGTGAGELIGVNSFGESWQVARVGGPVRQLAADPDGSWWALRDDGSVWSGSVFSDGAREVATVAHGVYVDCDGPVIERGPDDVTAIAFGRDCGAPIRGTVDGAIGGVHVSGDAIRTVAVSRAGILWVDAAGRAGCEGCVTTVPATGVVDAILVHAHPFVPGENLWIDQAGGVWVR